MVSNTIKNINVRTNKKVKTLDANDKSNIGVMIIPSTFAFGISLIREIVKDVEDYMNQSNDTVAITAAQKFANMMYGLEEDYESTLPENEFLKEFEFVDENLRLVNEEGKLVDIEGKEIDEFGRYVDSEGNPIDREGDQVSDDGKYAFQRAPFLDDSGEPIVDEAEEEQEQEPEASERRRAGRGSR